MELFNSLPYSPQTQGLVERVNQTIKRPLLRYLAVNNRAKTFSAAEFKQQLADVVHTYNHTTHSTTKHAPVHVYFGYRAAEKQPPPSAYLKQALHARSNAAGAAPPPAHVAPTDETKPLAAGAAQVKCPRNPREEFRLKEGAPAGNQPSKYNWRYCPDDVPRHVQVVEDARRGIDAAAETMLRHTERKINQQELGAARTGRVVKVLGAPVNGRLIEERGRVHKDYESYVSYIVSFNAPGRAQPALADASKWHTRFGMELIPHHATTALAEGARKVGDIVKVRRRTVVVGTLVRIARVRSEKMVAYKKDTVTKHETEGLITRRSQANQARQKFSQRDLIDPEATRAKITANWTREIYIVTNILSDQRTQDDRDHLRASDLLHRASFRYQLAEVDTTDAAFQRDEYTLKFTPSEIFQQLQGRPPWLKNVLKWCYYRSDLLPIWSDERTDSVTILKSDAAQLSEIVDEEGRTIKTERSDTLRDELKDLIPRLPALVTRATGLDNPQLQVVLDLMTARAKQFRAFVGERDVRVKAITSVDGELNALVEENGAELLVPIDQVLVVPKASDGNPTSRTTAPSPGVTTRADAKQTRADAA